MPIKSRRPNIAMPSASGTSSSSQYSETAPATAISRTVRIARGETGVESSQPKSVRSSSSSLARCTAWLSIRPPTNSSANVAPST